MSKTIKSIKTLKKHIGDTVRVDSYDGYTFDAKIVDNLRGGYLGLFTTDKAAEKDTYWWDGNEGYCHIITKPYQLKTELKSLTLVEAKDTKGKVKKTTKKSFVSAEELTANQGHYCEMADGTTGFIAGSKYPGRVCVLHNSDGDSDGWIISRFNRISEIKGVSKSFIKQFSKGWHVSSDDQAEQVKVAKILDEVSKPTSVKPKKTKRKESKKSFLTREQLLKHIGNRCSMSDGTEGLIVKTDMGNPRILMSTRANDHGWPYSGEEEGDDTGVTPSIKNQYKFAWNVCDDDDAEDISVVKILEDEKCAESSKTILDMTVREVLEKLNEVIISR